MSRHAGHAHRIQLIGGEAAAALQPASAGGKATHLADLHRIGLTVAPALSLDVSFCRDYHARGAMPSDFRATLAASIGELEALTGCTLGGRRPLLLSVRSSPAVSMPGMLETVLNVGLTDEGVAGLIRRTGNPWLAWDARRRLIRSFAETVRGQSAAPFDRATADLLARSNAASVQDLSPIDLRSLARQHADEFRRATGEAFPEDPLEQVVQAVEAVLRSWRSPRADAYRALNHLDGDAGMGVVLQAMVFGNSGARSGSGVGFTRDPATGDEGLYVDFLFNAQGEDIVAGRQAITDAGALPRVLPDVWSQLERARVALEREFRDMQDFEFTVEERRLFFLQTRAAKRTPWAALRVATELVNQRLIDEATAVERLEPYDLDAIVRTSVCPRAGEQPMARAIAASIGIATGAIVFDPERAVRMGATQPVVLMRPDLTTDDIAGLAASSGIVTTSGGRTSHAAVVARQLGKVCLVGCSALRIDEAARECTLGTHRLREGDIVTLDGENGLIYDGAATVVSERPADRIALVRQWRAPALEKSAPVAGILRS